MTKPILDLPRTEADVVEYIAPRRPGNSWSVRIRCPYCAKLHTHGAPDDGRDPGWRVPHCPIASLHQLGDYYIVADPAIWRQAQRKSR